MDNELECIKEMLSTAENAINEVLTVKIDKELLSSLESIKQNVNNVLSYQTQEHLYVITEMENFEFEMVSIEKDGILFRRVLDEKDFVFIKSEFFDDVIKGK